MARLLLWGPLFLFAASLAVSPEADAQTIQDVHVFQAAGSPGGETSSFLEITGQDFPARADLRVFIAPQRGLTGQPQIVSASNSQIVVKFTASADYFPATVGVAGTGAANTTFDVPSNTNSRSDQPRIDDVEVLQLDRKVGTGSIKIDGANFGHDPNNIKVSIVPRDPGLPAFAPVPLTPVGVGPTYYVCPTVTPEQQVLPPRIRTASDGVVVVDFSFPCIPGYSAPFRIARVILTLSNAGQASSSASYEVLPGRDKNLTYRSTILSQKQTASRFGGGIAKNFYAVQLSVVNKGSVKVQVPLASIQAEVEWFAGSVKKKYYREGPATVAPVPLAGAVSYFSTHRQSTGLRAKFFNTLQGLTTIGSAVQLFFGHGFSQGVAIAGGGFRQGLGQIFQDMSDQQLANLTSQSFESIETVSGNGGSIEKVIFIQRGEERLESGNMPTNFRRLIDNIVGFEINGYEVPETAVKAATPQS